MKHMQWVIARTSYIKAGYQCSGLCGLSLTYDMVCQDCLLPAVSKIAQSRTTLRLTDSHACQPQISSNGTDQQTSFTELQAPTGFCLGTITLEYLYQWHAIDPVMDIWICGLSQACHQGSTFTDVECILRDDMKKLEDYGYGGSSPQEHPCL